MTLPPTRITLFGVDFIFDPATHIIKIFDDVSLSMNAGTYKTLEILGVDYQVPVGKTLVILGFDDFHMLDATPKPIIYQTDVADLGTGEVEKIQGTSSSAVNQRDGVMVTFTSQKYVTLKNRDSVTRTGTVAKLIGLEYTT